MFPEKKPQNAQITGQKSLKCFLKKTAECRDNGTEVPERFPEKKTAECPDNGTEVPEMCPGKKNAKCPDNGTEVPEHSLEKIWQNAQITGQKSLKCFRKTICCLSDCHFGSPKNCFEKKMEKNHFLICHHWQNTQLMGQKSLKGSDRTPFNLLRLCFE